MKVLDGCRTPLELFGGVKLQDVKVLDGLWRVNSQQTTSDSNIRVRLGCHFVHAQGPWDADRLGLPCSHEVAGLGLMDNYYKNSKGRFRSAGIRQFNNRNSLPDQMGQLSAQVNIYGR